VSTSGRAGWLYAPAPGTAKLALPDRGTLSATTHGNLVTIEVTNAVPETQVFIPAQVAAASIAGKALVQRPVTALAGSSDGWAAVTTPFPGTIIKLDAAQKTTGYAIRLQLQ
jgi:hypothetical protein